MEGAIGRIERAAAYDHQKLERRRRVLRWLIRNLGFRFLVKIDRVEGIEHFPATGPAIVLYNHIGFVDPVVILANLPRNTVPLAKIEAYSYPVIGIFPRLWEVIPVRRGEVDRQALAKALRVLEAGEIILVAPEGTRSPALIEGREGAALLADRTEALVVPVTIEGSDRFPSLSPKRWREEGVIIKIGRPFRFRREGSKRADRARLRLMTDEAMYVLASMLREGRRGFYRDLSQATKSTIEFA